MYLDDFCQKEVISIKDCRKLGNVYNMEFDSCSGCICQIIVREKCGLKGFFGIGEEICIPYQKIKQIGPDIILVEV
ncbi:MAG: YlmC/YmxH family sporulation protein [Lachnospiraceae bacterium]|nr:YlmC/YmxH family sporulation protein [Lachnospiraceae bacterium]